MIYLVSMWPGMAIKEMWQRRKEKGKVNSEKEWEGTVFDGTIADDDLV